MYSICAETTILHYVRAGSDYQTDNRLLTDRPTYRPAAKRRTGGAAKQHGAMIPTRAGPPAKTGFIGKRT